MAKTLIIGPGALGAALGAALQRRGHDVAFIGRRGPVAFCFSLDHGQQAGMNPGRGNYQFASPDTQFLMAVELVLITVKAFDLAAALRHSDLAPRSAPIVSVGNGSVEDIIQTYAVTRPDRNFRLGLATLGVSLLSADGHEPCFGLRSTVGKVAFGAFLGPVVNATPCERQLTTADEIFAWEASALISHRRKWLYNTVINSICAAQRLPRNGELLAQSADLAAVFDEAYALGELRWGAWVIAKSELYAGLIELIQSTSANENSMARDRRLGLPTESDFLAGLARGDQRFPRLNALHALISLPPRS